MTEDKARLLSKIHYIGEYIFAFDQIEDKAMIEKKLAMFKKYVPGEWRTKFYVYTHPRMDIVSDVVHRVEWCRENFALPYLMRDEACWDSPDHEFYADLFSWTNWPASLFHKDDVSTIPYPVQIFRQDRRHANTSKLGHV